MAEVVNALVSAALLDDRARRKKESNAAIAADVDERTPFHVVKEAVRSAGGENQNDSLLQRRLHQRRGDYVQNLNELCTIQN